MAAPQDLHQQKSELRALIRQQLKTVSSQMTRSWGVQMREHLMALPIWHNSHTIMCFVSMKAEPDTELILRQILHERKALCLPRQTDVPGIMQAHQIAALFALQPGLHGIMEPPATLPAVDPKSIDLIIAPCLAASPDGTRLGHGGGYYDRFFALCPNATRVVLCPSQQVFQTIPHEECDLPAHLIVTEKGIL